MLVEDVLDRTELDRITFVVDGIERGHTRVHVVHVLHSLPRRVELPPTRDEESRREDERAKEVQAAGRPEHPVLDASQIGHRRRQVRRRHPVPGDAQETGTVLVDGRVGRVPRDVLDRRPVHLLPGIAPAEDPADAEQYEGGNAGEHSGEGAVQDGRLPDRQVLEALEELPPRGEIAVVPGGYVAEIDREVGRHELPHPRRVRGADEPALGPDHRVVEPGEGGDDHVHVAKVGRYIVHRILVHLADLRHSDLRKRRALLGRGSRPLLPPAREDHDSDAELIQLLSDQTAKGTAPAGDCDDFSIRHYANRLFDRPSGLDCASPGGED